MRRARWCVLCRLHSTATSVAKAQLNSPGTLLPKDLRDIGIQQELGHQVPLDIPFRDESGNRVPLSTFFGKRPVLLLPVYYLGGMVTLYALARGGVDMGWTFYTPFSTTYSVNMWWPHTMNERIARPTLEYATAL